MSIIKNLQIFLADDIQKMNQIIMHSLSTQEELINIVANHLISAGGKRMRPILTILCAKMFNYQGLAHAKLAAAVEFIHAATLLHDDVVDESMMRRFVPTANSIWGSKTSILVGDFLFSQSFSLMVTTNSIEAMEVLSRASAVIAEGEVSQLKKLKERRMMSYEEYEYVITAKTAELFAAACGVGAIIANCDKNQSTNLWHFGLIFGKIFQIVDDVLDYFGDAQSIGKNIGDDFFEGKVTLPLIILHEKSEQSQRTKLINIIRKEKRELKDFQEVKAMLLEADTAIFIVKYVEHLLSELLETVNNIVVTEEYKKYLLQLVKFVINSADFHKILPIEFQFNYGL